MPPPFTRQHRALTHGRGYAPVSALHNARSRTRDGAPAQAVPAFARERPRTPTHTASTVTTLPHMVTTTSTDTAPTRAVTSSADSHGPSLRSAHRPSPRPPAKPPLPCSPPTGRTCRGAPAAAELLLERRQRPTAGGVKPSAPAFKASFCLGPWSRQHPTAARRLPRCTALLLRALRRVRAEHSLSSSLPLFLV